MAARRITVTLDEDTYVLLAQWAEAEDRTVPYLVARIASNFVEENKDEIPPKPKFSSPLQVRKRKSPSPAKDKGEKTDKNK